MLRVDEHQFEIRYAPLACGLQLSIVGCALASVIAAIVWFVSRGS